MNKQVKKKWLSALESGKYAQGYRQLIYNTAAGKRYCCLGVLCDLWAKHMHKKIPKDYDLGEYLPPQKILDWAGLSFQDANDVGFVNDVNRNINDPPYGYDEPIKYICDNL